MADAVLLPDCARYSLRGDPATLADGCAGFGVPVPPPLRAARAGARAALWLGPDEVLLLGPVGTPAPPGVVVDIGERQVAFELSGRAAGHVLAAGCPLDLDALPVGTSTRTLLGKAEIVLWRTAPFAWRVEVWRSFAGYVRGLLAQAARDWL